jgi:hypothetical protein
MDFVKLRASAELLATIPSRPDVACREFRVCNLTTYGAKKHGICISDLRLQCIDTASMKMFGEPQNNDNIGRLQTGDGVGRPCRSWA